MNQRGNIILVIVILLGLIAVVSSAYLVGTKNTSSLQPTPSVSPISQLPTQETTNWKKYRDSTNGIEFKYPNNWFAEPSTGTISLSESTVFLDDRSFQIPTATEFSTPIQVYLNQYTDTTTNQKKYSDTTVEDGANRLKTYLYGESVKEVSNLSIGGRKAIQLSGQAGPGMLEGQSFKHTLIQMDGRLLIVSLSNNDNFESIYNGILSTIKFNTPIATRDFKTLTGYRNQGIGFGIKFPSNKGEITPAETIAGKRVSFCKEGTNLCVLFITKYLNRDIQSVYQDEIDSAALVSSTKLENQVIGTYTLQKATIKYIDMESEHYYIKNGSNTFVVEIPSFVENKPQILSSFELFN